MPKKRRTRYPVVDLVPGPQNWTRYPILLSPTANPRAPIMKLGLWILSHILIMTSSWKMRIYIN